MEEHIKQMMQAAKREKPADFNSAFEEAMKMKIAGEVEDMKKTVWNREEAE